MTRITVFPQDYKQQHKNYVLVSFQKSRGLPPGSAQTHYRRRAQANSMTASARKRRSPPHGAAGAEHVHAREERVRHEVVMSMSLVAGMGLVVIDGEAVAGLMADQHARIAVAAVVGRGPRA